MDKVLVFKGEKKAEEIKDYDPMLFVRPIDLMIDSYLLDKKLVISKCVCHQCREKVEFRIKHEPKEKRCITFLCKCGVTIFYPPKEGRDWWVKSFIPGYGNVRKRD